MMLEQILWPVISLGGMGLLFGGGLAYASKIFAIETDPRVSQVRDVLPGQIVVHVVIQDVMVLLMP